jgi:NADH-quinone oxidoreductase subunit H
MAEMNRTPFDISVAESEIVGGPFIEYSGMRFGIFYLAEFAAVLLNSALAVSLFMGGGQMLPIPGLQVEALLGLPSLGLLWFFGKTMTVIIVIQWCRFTLPRLRIDQLMDLAWKVMLPAAFVNLILTAVLQIFGFFPFAIGVGITMLLALVLLAGFRGRRRRASGIRLVSVPAARVSEVVAAG